ncbi:MAG TPA: GFA family protein [Devosia sp.]|nr:GFA family protein [Devosia sp.]
MTRTGSCLCGAVRYTLEGEPFLTGLCHCADCRKESGAMFTFYAKWPIAAFRYTGEIRTAQGRSFCPQCGGRLFNLHEHDVEIRLGSLDDAPTGLTPQQEGWTIRREHWLPPIPAIPQFPRDPPH